MKNKEWNSWKELEQQHRILGLKLKITYILLALRNLPYYHLMDIVIYRGEKWIITNGVTYHKWNLSKLNDDCRAEYIDQEEFKPEISFRNLKNRFWGTYHWKMTSWFHIELRNLVEGKQRSGKNLEKERR